MTVTRKRAVGLGRTVLVLAACLLLAACGRVELHANLDERQANEVLAVLLANGVDADKRNSIASDTGYQIRVGKSDVPRSMAMLAARGLPAPSCARCATCSSARASCPRPQRSAPVSSAAGSRT